MDEHVILACWRISKTTQETKKLVLFTRCVGVLPPSFCQGIWQYTRSQVVGLWWSSEASAKYQVAVKLD